MYAWFCQKRLAFPRSSDKQKSFPESRRNWSGFFCQKKVFEKLKHSFWRCSKVAKSPFFLLRNSCLELHFLASNCLTESIFFKMPNKKNGHFPTEYQAFSHQKAALKICFFQRKTRFYTSVRFSQNWLFFAPLCLAKILH